MSYGNIRALFAAANSIKDVAYNKKSLLYKVILERFEKAGVDMADVDPFYYSSYWAVIDGADEASNKAKEKYPNDTIMQDVFRHGYWSALLVEAVGATNAEKATTTYEDKTPNNNGLSREMDIFNNKVGRDLAIGKTFNSFEQCQDIIVIAINEGKFKKITDGKLVPIVEKAYAIRSYDGKTEVRREANFYSSKSYGWIGFEEGVTVLGEEGPFSKIEYRVGNNPKQGYVYTKCILPISFRDKDKDKKSFSDGEWYNPYSDGWYMSQAFNDLDTNNQGHLGHDLINKLDQTVRAIYDGTVKKASLSGANGYMVEIEHNVNGKKFYSFYSHMESKLKVKANDIVKAGQELGRMGTSGGVPEHLHLGVYTGNFVGSPFGYMAKSKKEHIINFSESTDNAGNRLAAKKNALLVLGKCTRGGLKNTYYDFLEVIKSNGNILE